MQDSAETRIWKQLGYVSKIKAYCI